MGKLFAYADQYVERCDWKDIALIKFCLCAMGIMIGLVIPREKKKCPMILAGIVFIVTYIPLMVKFGRIVAEGSQEE